MRKKYQDGLTIVSEIKEGKIEDLKIVLAEIEADIEENSLFPFIKFDTIHFCRFIIFNDQIDGTNKKYPATLIFSSNFDEPLKAHINELYDKGINGLNKVYQYCKGYPAESERSRQQVSKYLRQHNIGYNTLYSGTRGRSVVQIRLEAQLRNKIQLFLDKAVCESNFQNLRPDVIRKMIQDFVKHQPELKWAVKENNFKYSIWPRFKDLKAIIMILAILTFPLIIGSLTTGWLAAGMYFFFIVLLIGIIIKFRSLEKKDEQYSAATDYQHIRELSVREDQIVQNQMSSITYVKSGLIRKYLLQIVLWIIDLAARYVYTKGNLGTIPSIHYARWVLVDKGKRLIFFSNFDGSWENYLGDFIDKAATGLTAVWSNTRGFPRSSWLVHKGATDEQRFKAFARNSQIITNVWYSAYKDLSVQNINNNSRIRSGLFARLNEEQLNSWMRRL